MEIKVMEEKKNSMVFELKGASHTVCNILKKELWKDKDVKNVGYTVRHPLVGSPEFMIETDSGDPRKIITRTCQKIQKDMDKFGSEFKKGVKNA